MTGKVLAERNHVAIFPASHYVTPADKLQIAITRIEQELEESVKQFTKEYKLLEAQRLEQRTHYDIEMMKEIGFCSGIEKLFTTFVIKRSGSNTIYIN